MNFSPKTFIFGVLSIFILGSYDIANTIVIAAAEQSPTEQSPPSTQELFFPEIISPSESKGLTPKEKEKLQLEEGDVMDQVPGF